MRILFQGDSITDTGRTGAPDPGVSLGEGYPAKAAKKLEGHEIINRGISGNRTCDLVRRWGEDCVDLQPDVLSLLIGVNDTWRGFDANDPTSHEQYEANMRVILDRVKNETSAKLIILNPYLLDVTPERAEMHKDLLGKQEVAARLAKEYGAVFIDIQAEFDRLVSEGTQMTKLSEDGVHPTDFGHEVIAEIWLDAFSKM